MKVKISFEKATTILVIIASLGSLFIIYRQTNLMSKQFELQRLEQHKSVLPYLTMYNTSTSTQYSYTLSNKGIGPALVNEINIKYKDSIYKDHDLREFFNAVIVKEDSLFQNYSDIGHSSLSKGMLLPANTTSNLVMHHKKNMDKIRSLRKWFNHKIEIEIIYSSIYGEQWKLTTKSNTPIKLKSVIEYYTTPIKQKNPSQ
jgi:hypothetical protein